MTCSNGVTQAMQLSSGGAQLVSGLPVGATRMVTEALPSVGNTPPQYTYPHTIVLRPNTLTSGRGTGCVLNVPVTGAGRKAERVPTTPLPQ